MKPLFLCGLLAFSALLPLRAQTLTDPGFETPGKALVSTSAAPNGKAEISGIVAVNQRAVNVQQDAGEFVGHGFFSSVLFPLLTTVHFLFESG
ncbi:MAG: hypothetical protein M3Y13_10970 [Armatimonadota bacterium]|nr:hypothetical protein [Armatimonadota bacterium]